MGQHFQFLALFVLSEPPTPKALFFAFFTLFSMDQKYLSLLEELDWPFLNFSSIQGESRPPILGQWRGQIPGEAPNPFPQPGSIPWDFITPSKNRKTFFFFFLTSQMFWKWPGAASSRFSAPALYFPHPSRAPRGVFFSRVYLKIPSRQRLCLPWLGSLRERSPAQAKIAQLSHQELAEPGPAPLAGWGRQNLGSHPTTA